MAYYGCVDRSIASPGEIYGFLQKALLTIPESNPYRGSEEYSWNDFVYLNRFEGEIGNFNGVEVINFRGLEAYQARYMGGFVDV